jgi:hypothetical protein
VIGNWRIKTWPCPTTRMTCMKSLTGLDPSSRRPWARAPPITSIARNPPGSSNRVGRIRRKRSQETTRHALSTRSSALKMASIESAAHALHSRLALRPRGRQITAVPMRQAQIEFGVRRGSGLLCLPGLPGGWWMCAVGRPTQKRPSALVGRLRLRGKGQGQTRRPPDGAVALVLSVPVARLP